MGKHLQEGQARYRASKAITKVKNNWFKAKALQIEERHGSM